MAYLTLPKPLIGSFVKEADGFAVNRRKHLVLYWASSKTINLTYLHARTGIMELMKLAGLHSSDMTKRSKHACKNRPRPDMSHMTGELGIMQA